MHCYRYPLLDGHYLEYLDCVHRLPTLQISLPGLELDLRKLLLQAINILCFNEQLMTEITPSRWWSLWRALRLPPTSVRTAMDSFSASTRSSRSLFRFPPTFNFLNLSHNKAFIVCLKTKQLSLSKLELQRSFHCVFENNTTFNF